MEGKYIVKLVCKNCKASEWMQITEGKSVEEFLLENPTKNICSTCKCELKEFKEEK